MGDGLVAFAHLPALIMWGEADTAFRRQARERLDSTFAEHDTVSAEGAGPYVESDSPGIVATIRNRAPPPAREPIGLCAPIRPSGPWCCPHPPGNPLADNDHHCYLS